MKKIIAGDRLRKIMKERGLKQIDLARITEINPVSINRYVRQTYFSLEEIEKICEALGMELWEFFIDKKDLAQMCKVSPEMLEIVRTIEQLPPDIQDTLLTTFNAFIDSLLKVAGQKQRR